MERDDELVLGEVRLRLLLDRAAWWKEAETALVADVHVGKAAHFRRNGIGVPVGVGWETLARLTRVVRATRPRRLVVLGDLVHSTANAEWDEFRRWLDEERAAGPLEEVLLVLGNHDILGEAAWREAGVRAVREHVEAGLRFVHAPESGASSVPAGWTGYTCAGHVHPAVRLQGAGRASLRLPCWHVDEAARTCVFPAFGAFTGHHTVSPRVGDRIYAVADSGVVPVPVAGAPGVSRSSRRTSR